MKLNIYINPAFLEAFLLGDYTMSLDISNKEPDYAKRVFGSIHIGEVDVELDVDDQKIRQIAIDTIDEEIKRVRAAKQVTVNKLEERKAKLLSLEHVA